MLNDLGLCGIARLICNNNMAGIYIHIPFCKQACHYCNFHFSTLLKYKEKLVWAIGKEISLRKSFLENHKIETVYFGGGTPSILNEGELFSLIDSLNQSFDLSGVKEFTFEANPDDLSPEYLAVLAKTPINRLSIGVQSFFDEHLVWMNRAHKSREAIACIKRAQDLGLENISVDLIYGIPLLSNQQWEENLQHIIDLDIKHVSAYCLTVEPKTALAKMIDSKTVPNINEEQAGIQFDMLMKQMKHQGFEHYEISNFAKPGNFAIHNTNYWHGKHYLGLGPGAHSFKGNQRSWNISNNQLYVQGIESFEPKIETETLKENELYNEYIMTSLRTQWGCDRSLVQTKFGSAFLKNLDQELKNEMLNGRVQLINNAYVLTATGKFFADGIASSAFITE
ncbi:MAG: radical SAM family heme chaperone HemW [Bacteroidota bacterium]|nr:radical SAM family heme chaperone HemW [Bacteroidota bacterium]